MTNKAKFVSTLSLFLGALYLVTPEEMVLLPNGKQCQVVDWRKDDTPRVCLVPGDKQPEVYAHNQYGNEEWTIVE